MALITEDGSGKSDAEAYSTVAEYRAYHLARGTTVSAVDATCEAVLRTANSYIESWRASQFRGTKASKEQALSWPRLGARDTSGWPVDSTEIPAKLKQAEMELAYIFESDPPKRTLKRGDDIIAESLPEGISTTYNPSAPPGKTYPLVEQLLDYLCNPAGRLIRA